MLQRPSSGEYDSYYDVYVRKVPDGNIVDILVQNLNATMDLLSGIDEDKAMYCYAPGKWSIKKIVGHVSDIERVFTYRALMFARDGKTPLASVDQDVMVENAGFESHTLQDLAAEFQSVRQAMLSLVRGRGEGFFARIGTASGLEFTVRAVLYIVAGHELHHMNVIRERYL